MPQNECHFKLACPLGVVIPVLFFDDVGVVCYVCPSWGGNNLA